MNPVNNENNIMNSSIHTEEELKGKIKLEIPDKFDLSILGKIDLIEAEKIASEEVIFLTEEDLIEGLEDFELVPIKNYKDSINPAKAVEKSQPEVYLNEELIKLTDVQVLKDERISADSVVTQAPEELKELIISKHDSIEPYQSSYKEEKDYVSEKELNVEQSDLLISNDIIDEIGDIEESLELIEDHYLLETKGSEIIPEKNAEFPISKKLFTVKINEETLDAQLSSILQSEFIHKSDEKLIEKYSNVFSDSKCIFVDDQFINKELIEDTVSYNEDPLTERLVKMIEVADGKLELLDINAKEGEYFNYILEDYTLYNSEKFDNVFKEEIFYADSDFEFIDNAIIRDDFTKYIHEIDDYFESEESLIQSEISEILGLIPDENEFIEDKLFGNYYKRYDLDSEIDFIKPEIDFFRSNYTGTKELNYFSENEESLLDSEKISIEEDISSPNAIVFEESISEIESILSRDFGFEVKKIVEVELKQDEIIPAEDFLDITDKIIILDDKEKLMELASEFPEKHENLIRLLSYLDGLFEKLPEEVIRKFAESEYFELYSKVLKEMGV